MKAPIIAALTAALCLSLTACQPQTPPANSADAPEQRQQAPATAAAPLVDLEQLSQRLVANAAVKEGDAVMISGRNQDAELMENIAVQVRRAGGFPMVVYRSDRLSKRLFFDVPEQYDAQPDTLGLALAKVFDVGITLNNGTSENLFEGADPSRVAARSQADEAVSQAIFKNNVRMLEVGNGLYPTAWRAERMGMSEAALARMFWDGVNLDYSELQTRGAQVKAALAAGNELHITHPNGTDFKVQVKGRPVMVSDGIVSADDIRQGGAAASVYLPAGEVYTTPVPGSGNGRIVSSRDYFRGQAIDNLTVDVTDGKMTSLAGSGPGFAGMKAEYDAVADERKNLFGFIDLGINPNIRLPAGSLVGNWVPAGAVTVGTGSNVWAGGDNSVAYGMIFFLPGSTVTLDGKAIVENGELKL